MKCIIDNASWYYWYPWKEHNSDENTSPCKNAYQEKDGRWYIDIDSMNQLKEIVKEVGFDIVINVNDDDCLSLTIHDAYIE